MEDLGEDLVRLLDRTNCDVLMATPTTDLPIDLDRLSEMIVPAGHCSKEMGEVKGKDGPIRQAPNTP